MRVNHTTPCFVPCLIMSLSSVGCQIGCGQGDGPAPARELIIESSATFCGLGPPILPTHRYFQAESTITFTPAAYPVVPAGGTLAALSVTVTTINGTDTFRGTDVPYAHQDLLFEDGTSWDYDAIGMSGASLPGDRGSAMKLMFQATHLPEQAPDLHYRLRDPGDSTQWLIEESGVQVDWPPGEGIFPHLMWDWSSIFYRPCDMDERPAERFHFEFAEGGYLDLVTKSAIAVREIGRQTILLVSARGEMSGQAFEVTQESALAVYTNWSSAVPVLPSFAIRTSHDLEASSCGFVLAPRRRHPETWLWEGYLVYEMTCDERQGRELVLSSETYPPNYVWPD